MNGTGVIFLLQNRGAAFIGRTTQELIKETGGEPTKEEEKIVERQLKEKLMRKIKSVSNGEKLPRFETSVYDLRRILTSRQQTNNFKKRQTFRNSLGYSV